MLQCGFVLALLWVVNAAPLAEDRSATPPKMTFEIWPDVVPASVSSKTRTFGGIGVFDFDNDKIFEIFLNGNHGPNVALKFNNVTHTLADIAPAFGLDDAPDAQKIGKGVAVCDVDGDGREEIYVSGVAQDGELADRLFRFNHRISAFVDSLDTDRSHVTESVACLDAAGSGVYDIIVGELHGNVHIYDPRQHNVSVLVASLEAQPAAQGDTVLPHTFRVLLVGPLMSHGPPAPASASDVFVCDAGGNNQMLEFSGLESGVLAGTEEAIGVGRSSATYQVRLESPGVTDSLGHARTGALVDVNGDGLLDILLLNSENPEAEVPGSHHLFVNTGNGVFQDATFDALKNNWGHARAVVVADFDNDGRQEIFIANAGSTANAQPNLLLRQVRQGNAFVWQQANAGAAVRPDKADTAAVAMDLDGDGLLELVLVEGEGESEGGGVHVFRVGLIPDVSSDAPALSPFVHNHFLRVLPTTPFGAPARGAVVTISQVPEHDADNNLLIERQSRLIDVGGGSLSAQEPIAHFGLGPTGVVYSVQVTWPDGASVSLVNPHINTLLHIPHPNARPPTQPTDPVPPTTPPSETCDEELGVSCVTYILNPCPISGANACREGYFFDRSEGSQTQDDKCYCRKGFGVSPCPQLGTPFRCQVGFHFQRVTVGDSEQCFCREGDGLGSEPAVRIVSAEDLALFDSCLSVNRAGPLRCIALMEDLGYPLTPFGNDDWVILSEPPSSHHGGSDHGNSSDHGGSGEHSPRENDWYSSGYGGPGSTTPFTLNICPAITEDDPCPPSFALRRTFVNNLEKCICEPKQTVERFPVFPCPPPAERATACQAGYHMPPTTGHSARCECVKNEIVVAPCPHPSQDSTACEEGYHLERSSHGTPPSTVCQCVLDSWPISPCPALSVSHAVCHPPFVLERVSSEAGESCSCRHPGSMHVSERQRCEQCAYHHGECAYNRRKGWYCRCSEPGYTGPDCIHD